MRRIAIVAVVLCAVTINLASEPNQGTKPYKQPTAAQGQTTITFINNESPAAQAEQARSSPPKWYASPGSWLVAVAMLTLITIGYQSRETARSAKAMQKSVQLQEAALRQWVNIKKWHALPYIQEDGTRVLNIQFNVVNPTNLPLTLNAVFTEIGGQRRNISRKNLIPPKNRPPL